MDAIKDGDQTLLSVLIPIYDEKQNLVEVVEEIVEKLTGRFDYEILMIDDGSQDGTGPALDDLATNFSEVKVLRHDRNRGKSAALVTGALAARGLWLGTMDGDGQNDPADLVAMLEEGRRCTAEEGGVWLVAGQRRRRRDTVFKRLQSRTANALRRFLLRDGTPDTGCGLKVIPCSTFLQLPRFAHMHRFLPALVRQQGGNTVSVLVADRPRAHGQSKYGFWNRLWVGITDVLGVIWLGRRALPMSVLVENPDPQTDQ